MRASRLLHDRLLLLLLLLLLVMGLQHSRTSCVAVLGEQRHAAERLAARRTRVLLHVRVGLQVGAQVGPVGESPVAVLARERLLAGVGADVALQQPRPAERLAAYVAYARQRVRADVHLERAERVVRLVAVLAAERLDGAMRHVVGAVILLVLGQTGNGRVRFRASDALVPSRAGRRLALDAADRRGVALAAGILLLQLILMLMLRLRWTVRRRHGGRRRRGRRRRK